MICFFKKNQTLAFGEEKGLEIAKLVNELFEGKTAMPLLSLVAVELVFVLEHPDYYLHYGFTPAGVLGLEDPYPVNFVQ